VLGVAPPALALREANMAVVPGLAVGKRPMLLPGVNPVLIDDSFGVGKPPLKCGGSPK
jgi:hypothetical protein